MGVETNSIKYCIYNIICDSCGDVVTIDTIDYPRVFNRRDAVRAIGWSFGRCGNISCKKCRTHYTCYVPL